MNHQFLDIISALATTKIMPQRSTVTTVKLKNGCTIPAVSCTVELGELVIDTDECVYKYPLAEVVYVAQNTKTILPDLPPCYLVPAPESGSSWVINNMRAILQEVNTVAMERYNHSVVVTVDVGTETPNSLDLTMSGFWSELPVYIRHRFMEVLWSKYLTMLECYDMPEPSDRYRQIYMWHYQDRDFPIGVRSKCRLLVRGGVPVVFTGGV